MDWRAENLNHSPAKLVVGCGRGLLGLPYLQFEHGCLCLFCKEIYRKHYGIGNQGNMLAILIMINMSLGITGMIES